MSKTLIAYASTHGAAEKSAEMLQGLLEGGADLLDLKKDMKVDLSGYGRVVVGGSIHAGRMQSKTLKFVKKYHDELAEKELGLYVCCMTPLEEAWHYIGDSYPEDLVEHAAAAGIFGGFFNLERMNFIEKFIIKKVAKVQESVSSMQEGEIKKFAALLNGGSDKG